MKISIHTLLSYLFDLICPSAVIGLIWYSSGAPFERGFYFSMAVAADVAITFIVLNRIQEG